MPAEAAIYPAEVDARPHPSGPDNLLCAFWRVKKKSMSLRTSPQTGVAIPRSVAVGLKIRGIPTPVCALARNDMEIPDRLNNTRILEVKLWQNVLKLWKKPC